MNRNGPSSAPPTDVECPLTNFVREWTMKSAPSRNGCWRYGEQNVLSTTSGIPRASVRREIASMSQIRSVGFSGDSRNTAATFGCRSSVRATSWRSPVSQKTASTPNFERFLRKLSVQP